MAKIALRYVGKDKAEHDRLKAQKGIRFFEPVDAKEELSKDDTEYEIDEENAKLIGMRFEPGKDISIPQLHGADNELQTGISENKYGRSAVVQGGPDGTLPPGTPAGATADRPMTTQGRPLSGDPNARRGHEPAKASEGLNVEQLKSALDARAIDYKPNAKKEELAQLLDDSGAHK